MQISRRGLLGAAGVTLLGGASHAFAQGILYRYDAMGRLRCVTYPNGDRVQYDFDSAGNRTRVERVVASTFTTTIAITGSGPVDLYALALAAGYDALRSATITFTLANNVMITGAAGSPNGGVAIDTGDWALPYCHDRIALNLALQISGKVYGGGGRGGRGGQPGNAQASGLGGDAINCRVPIAITVNSGGEVKAGGGGGGGGGAWYESQIEFSYGGGGGGGGFPNGAGGAPGASSAGTPPTAGAAGTTSGGGAGGSGNSVVLGHGAGAGAAGGGAGASGAFGGVATGSPGGGWVSRNPSAGSAAGYAIRKNGNTVPVTNNGTIIGTQG